MIAACSALTRRYRDFIRERVGLPVVIVHPDMDPAELRRLALRSGHFMPPSLLDSQLQARERPDPVTELVCTVDAALATDVQVGLALAALRQPVRDPFRR